MSSDLDRDLRSVQEARELTRTAAKAQARLEELDQEQVDAIVRSMAAAGLRESERLATMAVEETGYGNQPDKVAKNNFVLDNVVEAMCGMRTVGVLRRDEEAKIIEIAEPVGVVAGIIPTTNPTSTAMFKCLIALKARCGVVLSPHPNAKACIKASADVMHEAAVAAGAPRGIIGCMSVVSMEGTDALMKARDTDVILATGGMGLVRAAYSAGKPAYGVGPGNVPAYIERSADIDQAVRDVFSGTTFDNGTLCSSEQAIVCDRAIADQVRAAIKRHGGHMLSPAECEQLAPVLITEKLLVDGKLVGQTALRIAEAAGLSVPPDTRVLVCPQEGVGRDYPLSHEKLSPVIAYYEVEDWKEGCERCQQLLRFGGLGHSMVIHCQDEEIVLQFGLYKPAHRVMVNTVSAVGAVGLSTNLFPSMTLGCGSWGNNITSDNVGPQHLVNVKRVAYGVRPFVSNTMQGSSAGASAGASRTASASAGASSSGASAVSTGAGAGGAAPAGPMSPLPAAATGGGNLPSQVAGFLQQRGIIPRASDSGSSDEHEADCGCESCESSSPNDKEPPEPPRGAREVVPVTAGPAGGKQTREASGESESATPVDFVAESDVIAARDRGETIRIGPKTIITPLAYELGEQHGIFERR